MIAEKLHMTVSQLMENTTGEELMNWVAFFRIKAEEEEKAWAEHEQKK